MAAGSQGSQIDTAKALKNAKGVLAKANAFSNSVPGSSQFAPKVKTPSAPAPKKPMTSGEEIASSLNSKSQNVNQYLKSLPKMHKGGMVDKDGVYQMKAGETVRTPEQEKKMQDHIKKASSAAQVMTKDEPKKKDEKPAEKKEHKAGKKKNHAHKVEVEKKKGGYLVKTHQQPEEGQPQQAPEESVHPDMASVNAHMNDAMGPDEAQAPQGGAEPSAPAAQPIPGV